MMSTTLITEKIGIIYYLIKKLNIITYEKINNIIKVINQSWIIINVLNARKD